MEQSETGDAQQDEAEECVDYLQQVGEQALGIVENPIGKESTEQDNGAVNEKNAPIGQ